MQTKEILIQRIFPRITPIIYRLRRDLIKRKTQMVTDGDGLIKKVMFGCGHRACTVVQGGLCKNPMAGIVMLTQAGMYANLLRQY